MAEETKIIRIIVDSSRAVDGSAAATRALQNLQQSAASIDTAMSRMEGSLGRIGGYMKANLAIMAAEIAARFVQMGKDAFNAVAGLDELSEQLGVTTKFLQGAQFAAVQSGVKLEQLETGFSKFSQKMGEAANGSKDMVEALNALGVKNLDVAGKLRPTEALMHDVAEAILKIDEPAKRAAAAVDFFGKAGTRMLPMLADIAAGSETMAQKAAAAGAMIDEKTIKALEKLADRSEVASLRWRAMTATLGEPIATWAMEKINSLLESVLKNLDRVKELEATKGSRALQNDAQNLDEQIAAQQALLKINPGNKMVQASLAALEKRKQAATDAANAEIAQRATTLMVSGTFAPTEPLDAPGVSTSSIKGAGQAEADKIAKLKSDTKLDLEAANAYAAASERGARAVADLEVHFKALKAAQDAYGKTAEQNAGQVAALTATIEAQMKATDRAKNLKEFNLGTEDLERSNQLLEVENALINASAETRAREIALIKLKNEVQSKGLDESNELEKAAIDRRSDAITQNERLKAQGEELKKANELWTAPLKSALESIQRTGADAFEQMLTSGNFTFQSLGDTFKKIVIRMAAEFMALATIRPVMSVIVNAVSPSMGASLGYGGVNGGMGGMQMPGGGLGGMQMPGGMGGMELPSWLGGGSVSEFFAQPVGSLFSSAAPAGGYADVGALLASGNTGASAAATGATSVGSALGAGLGIGMGAYQAITSKSLGGTLGGIGQMIGGGMMLIPGMQIPGMIVSALSAILPSIIGEPDTRTHSSTNASLRYGSGSWYTTGGAYGANANSGQSESALRGTTAGIDSVFGLMGGVKDASKVWGLNLNSWTAQGKDWSYTSRDTSLVDPTTGTQEAWRMNMGDMMDTGAAQVAIRSILSGAVGEISATMKTALESMRAASMGIKETAESIVFVDEVYERFGKGALTVRTQFRELEQQFSSMTDKATKLGLALAPIEAEQAKQTKRVAQDFLDSMLDPLAVQLRALNDERTQSLANAEYIRDNVKDVYVDMTRIAEYWTKKETDLREQFYAGSVSSLQALLQKLTYGDLANASPDTTLSGTRGTYSATLAQSKAGSGMATSNLAGYAESYASAARSYFGSSPEYAAIVEQIRRDLEERVGANGSGTASANSATNEATNAVLQSNAELRAMVSDLVSRLSATNDALAAATAQIQRRA